MNNDGNNDDADDGNANHMQLKVSDGPFCKNVQQILDMTLAKPRFRDSVDQLLLQGTMGSCPPEAQTKAS